MPAAMKWTSSVAWWAPSSERVFGVSRVCALGCGLVTDNEEIFSDGYQSNKKRGDSPKRRTLSDAPEDMPTPVEPGGDRPPDSANKNTRAKEAATEPATSVRELTSRSRETGDDARGELDSSRDHKCEKARQRSPSRLQEQGRDRVRGGSHAREQQTTTGCVGRRVKEGD